MTTKKTSAEMNSMVHMLVQKKLSQWSKKIKKDKGIKNEDNSFAILGSNEVMMDELSDDE